MKTNRHRSTTRRVATACTLCAALSFSAALQAGSCPPLCLTPTGVKNAAGVDPKLFSAISFGRGDASVDASAATITQIAREWQAAGGKGVLRLAVQADAGLSPAAAARLADARATALARALVAAGIPAAQVKVTAAR